MLSRFLTLNVNKLLGGSSYILGVAIMFETASTLLDLVLSHTIIRIGTVNVFESIVAYALKLSFYIVMTDSV